MWDETVVGYLGRDNQEELRPWIALEPVHPLLALMDRGLFVEVLVRNTLVPQLALNDRQEARELGKDQGWSCPNSSGNLIFVGRSHRIDLK